MYCNISIWKCTGLKKPVPVQKIPSPFPYYYNIFFSEDSETMFKCEVHEKLNNFIHYQLILCI